MSSTLFRVGRLSFIPAYPRPDTGFSRARQSAARIQQQPGCRHLTLWPNTGQPHVYCPYSHRDDAAALDAYWRSALFGEVWPATKCLLAAPAQTFSVVRAE